MYRATEGFGRIFSTPLPSGDQGTRKTLAAMVKLSDQGSRDPLLRERVVRVLGAAGVSPHNVLGQVNAWFNFVRDQIYFLHDPVATEWLQTPRYTLHAGSGDCDDRAVLLAAGLKSFGVPASFKVVAADPRRRDTYTHVYVVARQFGRDLALDPTYASNALGDEPPFIYRTWMVPA